MLFQQVFMEEFAYKPPKFNENNFNLWKSRMSLFLEASGPDIPYAIKYTRFDHLDAKVKHIIADSLPDNVFQSVLNCSSAKEMWDTLCLIYEGTENVKEIKKVKLNREYELFLAKNGESVTDTYNRFNGLLNDLRAVGIVKEKVALVYKFVNALPNHWDDLTTSLRMNDSLAALYGTLLYLEQLKAQ